MRDTRVDDYVGRQADFARPILEKLRGAVHAACPACEETIKWGMPAFMYKGKLLAGMAAFKAHATFGVWQRGEAVGPARKDGAMGQLGRLTSLQDLPDAEALAGMIGAAVAAIESGAKVSRAATSKPAIEMPADFAEALAGNPAAGAVFDSFPPSARREYLEWIMGAKRAETRARRVEEAIGWIAEGKKRHWKYEGC